MSEFDWRGAGFGSSTLETPFAQAVKDAGAVLGPVPTLIEGPVVRWYDRGRLVSVHPAGDDITGVVVEQADAAADEEYRNFESLPPSALPYRWRADDLSILPDGSFVPGEWSIDDFDALTPMLTHTATTLLDALLALSAGRSEAQLHLWRAEPAHDALSAADRRAARRMTSLSMAFKAGDGVIRVMPLGARAHADRLTFPATSDGVTGAVDALMPQLTASGAPNPSALRQASLVYLDRRKLALSPFALGIAPMGLWA